jgi:hypothetical protein
MSEGGDGQHEGGEGGDQGDADSGQPPLGAGGRVLRQLDGGVWVPSGVGALKCCATRLPVAGFGELV